MFRIALFISMLINLILLLAPTISVAEPYIAQRLGQKCSVCHTNMTGGGKRTAAGLAFGIGLTEKPLTTNFSTNINDQISLGANFRANYSYTAFSDPETVGPVQGDELEDASSFEVANGVMYMEFAVSENLIFYLDQQVAPEGGRTREALMLYKGLFGNSSYLKAGRFYLPYGLRLEDDFAFIRQSTGFNFDNSDIGVEFGFEPGPFSFSVALTNGTQGAGENNKDKQLAIVGAYVQPNYRIGASVSKNNSINGLGNTSFNVFSGLNLYGLTFLAEIDFIEQSQGNATTDQVASFFSVNYLLQPSLNLKFAYDYFDPNEDVDEDEESRISLVLEKFMNQYFQIRGGLRVYEGIPQNTFDNRNLLFSELHFYF